MKYFLKRILFAPRVFKAFLHRRWPQYFGQQVLGPLVQLYIHNQSFTTWISFSHFIHFFSNLNVVDITVTIDAFDRQGQSCGKAHVELKKMGNSQFRLQDLIPAIDEYGMFSVSMKLSPSYHPELLYMGAVSPQFMTIYQPLDDKSSPQMLHSHRKLQGFLPVSKKSLRKSSHVEPLSVTEKLDMYFVNSSRSKLLAGVNLIDSQDNSQVTQSRLQINAYGVGKVSFLRSDIQAKKSLEAISFQFLFDRPVDHKKPIVFRHSISGIQSCNHT